MKTMQRKTGVAVLALMLMLALAAAGFPVRADTNWPEPADAAEFVFNEETGLITGYTGTEETLVIPADINGNPVIGIDTAAFQSAVSLRRVKLSEGIKVIGASAFYFLENLNEISLPQSLEVILDYAFFQTGLKEIVIPPAVFFVGRHAFDIAAGFESLVFTGERPYLGQPLVTDTENKPNITAPPEVAEAYRAALGLPVVPGEPLVKAERHTDQSLFEITPDGVITGYSGRDVFLEIPAEIEGTAVSAIGEKAFFAHPTVRGAVLPEGITVIGRDAFSGAKLLVVSLPPQLSAIEDNAFFGCPLAGLTLPDSVTAIGERAFFGMQTDSLQLPAGLTAIAADAFGNSALGDVTIPAGIKSIGPNAFKNSANLAYVIFNASVLPDIDASAFLDCPLVDVDIAWDATKDEAAAAAQTLAGLGLTDAAVWRANNPLAPPYPDESNTFVFDGETGLITSFEGPATDIAMYWTYWSEYNNFETPMPIKGLGPRVFENSQVESFYVPYSNDFAAIGEYAFAGSRLSYIDLFDSVTEIGQGAFENCADLTAVTLPNNGLRIGRDAFAGTRIETLVIPATAVLDGPLGLDPAHIRFAADVTDEQLAAFAEMLEFPWYLKPLRDGESGGLVEMPDDLEASPAGDFEFDAANGEINNYLGSDEVIVVPAEIEGTAVRSIGFTAFSSVEGDAVTIILPPSVTTLQDSAFVLSDRIVRVEAYGPLDYVGIRAFEGCENLETVIFHNGVKTMGNHVFQDTRSLRDVDLGSALDVLSEGTFASSGLRGTVKLDYVTVGPNAFNGCADIESIVVGARVESIGAGAFQNMPNLKSVVFERPDAAILGSYEFQFSEHMDAFDIVLPHDATDEDVAAFVLALEQNALANAAERVKRRE